MRNRPVEEDASVAHCLARVVFCASRLMRAACRRSGRYGRPEPRPSSVGFETPRRARSIVPSLGSGRRLHGLCNRESQQSGADRRRDGSPPLGLVDARSAGAPGHARHRVCCRSARARSRLPRAFPAAGAAHCLRTRRTIKLPHEDDQAAAVHKPGSRAISTAWPPFGDWRVTCLVVVGSDRGRGRLDRARWRSAGDRAARRSSHQRRALSCSSRGPLIGQRVERFAANRRALAR